MKVLQTFFVTKICKSIKVHFSYMKFRILNIINGHLFVKYYFSTVHFNKREERRRIVLKEISNFIIYGEYTWIL